MCGVVLFATSGCCSLSTRTSHFVTSFECLDDNSQNKATNMIADIVFFILLWTWRTYLAYFSLCFVTSFVGVYQEYKIWAPSSVPSLSLWGMIKVYLFNVVWSTVSLLCATVFLPKYLVMGNVERDAVYAERFLANLVVTLFVGPVVIKNAEKIPPEDASIPAHIFICNHASQIDLGAVYAINRRFKWIAKGSVKLMPGVGQIMTLSNHVFIDRKTGKNKASVSNLYEKSNAAVQSGCPMFFFPQGTRRMAERLPFKDGALNVALHNKSPLVPLSLNIPLDAWNRSYPFGSNHEPIVITVHDTIKVKGDENKDELRKKCFDTIYSILPDHRVDSKKDK